MSTQSTLKHEGFALLGVNEGHYILQDEHTGKVQLWKSIDRDGWQSMSPGYSLVLEDGTNITFVMEFHAMNPSIAANVEYAGHA